jgi:hypothetical protein
VWRGGVATPCLRHVRADSDRLHRAEFRPSRWAPSTCARSRYEPPHHQHLLRHRASQEEARPFGDGHAHAAAPQALRAGAGRGRRGPAARAAHTTDSVARIRPRTAAPETTGAGAHLPEVPGCWLCGLASTRSKLSRIAPPSTHYRHTRVGGMVAPQPAPSTNPGQGFVRLSSVDWLRCTNVSTIKDRVCPLASSYAGFLPTTTRQWF